MTHRKSEVKECLREHECYDEVYFRDQMHLHPLSTGADEKRKEGIH